MPTWGDPHTLKVKMLQFLRPKLKKKTFNVKFTLHSFKLVPFNYSLTSTQVRQNILFKRVQY